MENLNAEQIKKALECCISGDDCTLCPLLDERSCPCVLNENVLALINSQEQRIKELTQMHEMLSESYDHLAKTKDELLAERSRLTEENEKIGIENFDLICKLSRIKEDTVKELRDKLLARKVSYGNISFKVVPIDDIEAICREMTGGDSNGKTD